MGSLGLSRQKVLVTGASGFIGSHLCRALSREGAEVHGISRAQQKTDANVTRWWQVDLADSTGTREVLGQVKPRVIYHMAGETSAARKLEVVLPIFQSTVLATVNVLTAASEVGCQRLILAGSLEEPQQQQGELVPSSPYAAAKWATAGYARMFHQLFGTPTVVARIFMVYGPGQKEVRKLIPYVIRSLLRGESPKLSSGQRLVDWIYVEDVVEGLLKAAEAPHLEGSAVDLGSGRLVSVRAVVEKLFQLVGSETQPVFGESPDRPNEQVRTADTAETYAKIGWTPKTSLEEGLARTVKWYEHQLRVARQSQSPAASV